MPYTKYDPMFTFSVFIGSQLLLLYKKSQRLFFPHFQNNNMKFPFFLHVTYVILNASHSYSYTCIRTPMSLCCSPWARLKLGSFAFQGFAFLILKIDTVSVGQQDKDITIPCSFSNFFCDFEQVSPYFLLPSSGTELTHYISLYFETFTWCCRKADYYYNRVTSASI